MQGVSIPGTPFVAIGHNARIAWGFTNTGADVQDLVIERFDLAGRRVQGAGGWEPVQVEDAPIPVRGRADAGALRGLAHAERRGLRRRDDWTGRRRRRG